MHERRRRRRPLPDLPDDVHVNLNPNDRNPVVEPNNNEENGIQARMFDNMKNAARDLLSVTFGRTRSNSVRSGDFEIEDPCEENNFRGRTCLTTRSRNQNPLPRITLRRPTEPNGPGDIQMSMSGDYLV